MAFKPSPGYRNEADFLGGKIKYNLRKTGPRHFEVVGVLSYAESAVQFGFKGQFEVAVKVNATGALGDVVNMVPQIQALLGLFAPAQTGDKK